MVRNTFFRCYTFDKLKFLKGMKKVYLIGFLAITALLFSCDKEEAKTTATTTQSLTEKRA